MNCVIPFSGFYNSVHDDELTRAIECMLDTDGNGDCNAALVNHWHSANTYSNSIACTAYAIRYAAAFAEAIGTSWSFDRLDSPRYYNFETDRIFVDVSEKEARRWLKECDAEVLTRIAIERHTSRSGFISFYSPDWETWGNVRDFEPEQLHTLLLAWIETAGSAEDWRDSVESNGRQIAEYYLLESMNAADHAIDTAMTPGGTRLVNIAGYLRNRQERKFRRSRGAV